MVESRCVQCFLVPVSGRSQQGESTCTGEASNPPAEPGPALCPAGCFRATDCVLVVWEVNNKSKCRASSFAGDESLEDDFLRLQKETTRLPS